jgi:hypothetical protein
MNRSRLPVVALILAIGALASCSDDPQNSNLATSGLGPQAAPRPTCDPKKTDCFPNGRMTGGGSNVTIGDVKITKGFTLHCDIVLSNNLEINWPGHQWHLSKPISTAECVDDPSIDPQPPPAPFDTFNGTADGNLDGVEGSHIVFTLVDAGEPGGTGDKTRFLITAPDGSVALDLPLSLITGGNIQAHYDQPHK